VVKLTNSKESGSRYIRQNKSINDSTLGGGGTSRNSSATTRTLFIEEFDESTGSNK
jgi:hypothetical protein